MGAEQNNGYQLVAALFVRLLGVFYLIAFASIGVQIEGLAWNAISRYPPCSGSMPVTAR
jgi:hypothetical protein